MSEYLLTYSDASFLRVSGYSLTTPTPWRGLVSVYLLRGSLYLYATLLRFAWCCAWFTPPKIFEPLKHDFRRPAVTIYTGLGCRFEPFYVPCWSPFAVLVQLVGSVLFRG